MPNLAQEVNAMRAGRPRIFTDAELSFGAGINPVSRFSGSGGRFPTPVHWLAAAVQQFLYKARPDGTLVVLRVHVEAEQRMSVGSIQTTQSLFGGRVLRISG